jgi:ketosteroid isomerase-like protein
MDSRQLIEKYHTAWTSGDFAAARECLTDDFDFEGSIDAFKKADDFVTALKGFQGMLRSVTLLQSHFDRGGGSLLYDCHTATPAGVIRTAEFFSTSNDKISKIRLVFDATELRKLMGQSRG